MTFEKSFKSSYTLVEFRYGDPALPVYKRYTDWTTDVNFGDGVHLSTPSLQVTLPAHTGTLSEKSCDLVLPKDGFTDALSDGRPHSPVYVTVTEQVKRDNVLEDHIHFKGRLGRAVRNYQGQADQVLFECNNLKSKMEIPMGLPAGHHCVWTLGGRGCGLTITPSGATVGTISRSVITVLGLPGKPDRYWHRGFIEKTGLRLMIREWISGTTFYLVREPPGDWLNSAVLVTPGDDKTIETCRLRFNNEGNFAGLGYGIPAFNPTIESP